MYVLHICASLEHVSSSVQKLGHTHTHTHTALTDYRLRTHFTHTHCPYRVRMRFWSYRYVLRTSTCTGMEHVSCTFALTPYIYSLIPGSHSALSMPHEGIPELGEGQNSPYTLSIPAMTSANVQRRSSYPSAIYKSLYETECVDCKNYHHLYDR